MKTGLYSFAYMIRLLYWWKLDYQDNGLQRSCQISACHDPKKKDFVLIIIINNWIVMHGI